MCVFPAGLGCRVFVPPDEEPFELVELSGEVRLLQPRTVEQVQAEGPCQVGSAGGRGE